MTIINLRRKDALDRLLPYIEQAARDYYKGTIEKGFRHWSFSEIFIQEDFSDDDVQTNTLIDGPGDFGIDGYFIDHELHTINLFQSKYTETGRLDEDLLADFWESPNRLSDTTMVSQCKNVETKKLASDFQKLIPSGYTIHMVFAGSGVLGQSASKFAERNKSVKRNIKVTNREFDVQVELEIFDIKGLVELFEQHLSWVGVDAPNVEIKLIPDRYHDIRESFNSIKATIYASEIVRIFEEQGFKIFRRNPRGPLVNKINKDMYETLKDETWRPMFHLLNNGLSITCDSYVPHGNTLEVKNFQIVNGCQTTVTLDKAKNMLDDKVLVDIKVTECNPTIANKIAGTTNTQAGLKAQDFISTDTRQIELQKQFEALPEPWFYEIRRGEWARMVDHRDKTKFRRHDGTYRIIKIKDIAQAALSFAGKPGEAKDHTKTIFQHKLSGEDTQAHYEDIFSPSITAKQLFLYWLIYSNVKSSVDDEKTASDFPGYGRLHSVWLIGEMIRKKYAISTGPVIPDSLATLLATKISDWFKPLYLISKQALNMAVEVERTAKTDTYSHREFFRGTKPIILDKLPTVIEYAKTFSGNENPLDKLPHWKQSQ